MILFMTSSPDGDLMSGAKSSFDNRNGFLDRLKSEIRDSVFFTYIAADPLNHRRNDISVSYFAKLFEGSGISVSGYTVCDSRNALSIGEILKKTDVIMLGGGHVPTQNAFFEVIGLSSLIKSFGGVIIGVSAGSMNCASLVYAQPEEPGEAADAEYRKFIPGLGLTEINILPHYQLVKDFWLDGRKLYDDITKEDSIGHTFYVLRDGSYILIKEGNTVLYGEAWLMKNGEFSKICEYGNEMLIN